jgi:hypothetical protein
MTQTVLHQSRLLAILLLAATGCGDREPLNDATTRHHTIAERPVVTEIDKTGFSLTLPGVWAERASDDGFDFVNEALGEQILVSVLDVKRILTNVELTDAVKGLAGIRRESLLKLSGGRAQIEPTQVVPVVGQVAMRFIGIDSANKIRFITEIHGQSSRVVTISFYRYSLDTADEFGREQML